MTAPARLDTAAAHAARRSHAGRLTQLRLLLAFGDLAAGALAAWLSPWLWAEVDPQFTPTAGLPLWQWAFTLAWMPLLGLFGGGRVGPAGMGRRSLQAIGRATVTAVVLVLVLFYFAPFLAPRGSTLLTIPIAGAFTLGWRYAFLRVHERAGLRRPTAVLGLDEAARRAANAMLTNEASSFDVRSFIATGARDEASLPAPVTPLEGGIWELVERLGVDVLVVGHSRGIPEDVLADLARCYEHGVEALPATTVYEQLEGRVLASALEADWYAELPTGTQGLYVLVKRVVDIVVALVAGIVALPIMGLVALAIWRESGRPVLFRQARVGLRGEHFTIHKFRSMRHDAEPEGLPRWATPADERTTRVGRVLRRTRLDELPQLWDVLRGGMSLIGPRPERPEFVAQLSRELPLYRARALVLPGITGWAQIQYPYAGTVEENLAKLEYDLYYIRHFGPMLDARIALRTLLAILRPAGR